MPKAMQICIYLTKTEKNEVKVNKNEQKKEKLHYNTNKIVK